MKKILSVFFLACCSCLVMAQDNVIDEIVWVVGDDAILRSDIETQRLYNQNEGVRLDGDPYCVIPEQMAIQKLYLNQAKIDSITVNENQVIQSVDQWMNMAVNQIGSREKLEEYFGKKFSQIKDERKEMVREQQVVQQMQQQLIGEIKLTPSEVRKYFSQLSRIACRTSLRQWRCKSLPWNRRFRLRKRTLSRPAYVISRSKLIPVRWNSLRWLVCTRKIRVRRLEVVSWVS